MIPSKTASCPDWPEGNITGAFIINELAGKRLDLILNIAPKATTVGYLVAKQTNRQAEEETGKLLQAAQTMGR